MRYSREMNTRTITIGVIVLLIIIAGGYFMLKKPTTGSNTQNQSNATSTDQVQAQDVTVGTGTQATPGSVVSVLYTGKLQDGTVFDSSAAHGNTPLVFTLGAQGIIPGFQIGINGMKVGGERLILIPASLGYGAQVVGPIPANSSLVFDVKLVKVEAATSTKTQ